MILYHFTPESGLIGMMKTGTIQSSIALASSDAEVNKGQVFFISTARTRNNKYSKEIMGAVLTLDGTKLKQKYKTAPVDYWQIPDYHESEERILTNAPSIKLWPYLKALSINLKRFDDMSMLRKIVIACKKRKIPVYLFENSKDMYLNAVHKRVNLNEIDLSVIKPHNRAYYPESAPRVSDVESFLVLLHALGTPRFEKSLTVSKNMKEVVQQIQNYMRYGDFTGMNNYVRSELNMALRRGGRSYIQAISFLKLIAKKKLDLEAVSKKIGIAVDKAQ